LAAVDGDARSTHDGRTALSPARSTAVIDGTTASEAAFEASAREGRMATAPARRKDAGDGSCVRITPIYAAGRAEIREA
jgi:hypothetical protein